MEVENNEPKEAEPRRQVPEVKVIGLTGGIGSGKSTVANFLKAEGFPVYNSDDRAKVLVNELPNLKTQIIELLGNEAYGSDGKYNRNFVSKVVFENQQLLMHLNSIIHPAVRIDFKQWLREQKTTMVFQETALLFENNLHENCYKTILVTATQNIRIKRVMDRDGRTYREVETIVDNQMSEPEKEEMADFVINNNGTLKELAAKTLELIDELSSSL